MAEKDSGRYRYEPYPPLTTKQQNNGTNTMKKNEPPTTLKTACSKMNIDDNGSSGSSRCCSCVGPKTTSFWVGLLTNLGICTLLFAYTLLGKFFFIHSLCVWCIYVYFLCVGSFIFLAIEGGASTMQQRTMASTNRHLQRPMTRSENVSLSKTTINDATEARHRAVENLWDLTISLNILYKENWTR